MYPRFEKDTRNFVQGSAVVECHYYDREREIVLCEFAFTANVVNFSYLACQATFPIIV